MNIIKKYLEKKEQESERRKQEAFLNTRINVEDLFVCELHNCIIKPTTSIFIISQTFKPESIRILKRLKEGGDFDYIDPITKTQYRKDSNYRIESGDLVVRLTTTLNLPRQILERQYLTISELIELNEKLNQK